MKAIIHIAIISVLTYSCNANYSPKHEEPEARSGINNTADTTVSSITFPEGTEKEYFLAIQNDTSRFSLFVDANSNGNVVAGYGPGSDRDFSDYPADSMAVAKDPGPMKEPATKSYTQQIVELDVLLHAAAKDFSLQKLRYVSFQMRHIHGLSASITEQYMARHGERINLKSNQHTCTLIQQSALVADLNRILLPYKLMIDNISIDKLVSYKNKETFRNSLDGKLIFTIKPVD